MKSVEGWATEVNQSPKILVEESEKNVQLSTFNTLEYGFSAVL